MSQCIKDILQQLADSPGRLDKEKILLENKNNKLLQRVIIAALTPDINYYVKKIPDHTPESSFFMKDLDEALDDLGKLSSRELTGNAAINFLASTLNSLTHADADVVIRIIRRDLRCGVSFNTINKIWEGLIYVYPVQLCEAYEEKLLKNIKFPAYVQLKADGLRFNAQVVNNKCTFYSRNGSLIVLKDDTLYKDFVRIANGQNVVFDGEMLVYKDNVCMPRKAGNGVVNKAIKGTISADESKMIRCKLWDVIPYEDFQARKCSIPLQDRLVNLRHFVSNECLIDVIETKEVNSLEEAMIIYNQYIQMGLEGIIIKNKHSLWEDGRSNQQLKFKSEKECDLRVTGWNFGNIGTENEHRLGSLECSSEDGLVVTNVSGFSDLERDTLTPDMTINKIVAVRYNERITKKDGGVDSLFLPRILEFREDKTVADYSVKIK